MEGEWRSENHAKLFDNVVIEWFHVSDDVDLVTDTLQPPELHLLSRSFKYFSGKHHLYIL